MFKFPRVLHATFLHDKRTYNAIGKLVTVQEHDASVDPVRCFMQPRHVLRVDEVRTASGMLVHPIEGSGLHQAVIQALTKEAGLQGPQEPT